MRCRLNEDGETEQDWCEECNSLSTWVFTSPALQGKYFCFHCDYLGGVKSCEIQPAKRQSSPDGSN